MDAWVQCSFLVLEAGLELPHPRHPTWSVGLSFSLVSVHTIHTPPIGPESCWQVLLAVELASLQERVPHVRHFLQF